MQTVRTILVVDDEPAIVHVLALKLTQCGYRVLTAWDGAIALELARANDIDVVISDFQMPELNGMQLAAALRADPRTAKIPVITSTHMPYRQQGSHLFGVPRPAHSPVSPPGQKRPCQRRPCHHQQPGAPGAGA